MLRKNGLMLFGFMMTIGIASLAYAQEGAIRPDLSEHVKMWIGLAAGFGMALATIGGAIGQSKAISTAVDGIARNPGAQGKIFIPMIVGLALIESLVLLSFVVTNGLAGKI